MPQEVSDYIRQQTVNDAMRALRRFQQHWRRISVQQFVAHELLVVRDAPPSMYEESCWWLREMPAHLYKALLGQVETFNCRLNDQITGLDVSVVHDQIQVYLIVEQSDAGESPEGELQVDDKPKQKPKRSIDL